VRGWRGVKRMTDERVLSLAFEIDLEGQNSFLCIL
jgi:hypothetical protein